MSRHGITGRGSFGFTIKSVPVGSDGTLRTVARFECEKCRTTYDRKITNGSPLNSEACAKSARDAGWIADGWNKSGTRCPKCARAKTVNDPDSELKKKVALMNKNSDLISAPLAPAPVQPIRDPTPDQRLRIRSLLDKHFDDGLGMYLDDMSDNRLAEVCGVPRVVVERIREAAYGPIKVSPELVQIRAEVGAMKDRLAKMTADLASLASRIEKASAGKVG